MELELSASLDRPLIEAGEAGERYLMLTVAAPAGAAHRLPLNLGLAIDTSGSMAGEKLARVREAAGQLVRDLSAADRVSIVAYGDDVRIVAPPTELTPSSRTDLLYRIGRLEADGRTNLSGGWLTACRGVAAVMRGAEQLDRVVLLSDGLANVGITDLDALVGHARELRQRGITTSTMGVGVDFNEELLEALARNGGGRFQYVERAAAVSDCVAGELGELLQTAARGVALEVELPAGVGYIGCLNEHPTEDTPRGVRARLGDLVAGAHRNAVLRLRLAGGAEAGDADASARTIRTLALYTDIESGEGRERRFPAVELRVATPAEVEAQAPDADVEREVALLLAARAREEAVRLSRAGDYAAAAASVSQTAVFLRRKPAAATPEVADELGALMRLADEASRGLREDEMKEQRYRSYLAREARDRYDR